MPSALISKFKEENRFANFGDILVTMDVRGIRGHVHTALNIHSPITAVAGVNGVGKSTLLHVAAAAYKAKDPGTSPYYISTFILKTAMDPTVFQPDARVEYGYWQSDRTIKKVLVRRNAQRWRGYEARPQRQVVLLGFKESLPKIEHTDFVIRQAANLNLLNEQSDSTVTPLISKLLGQSYDDVIINTVGHARKEATVKSLKRASAKYSEVHMGYGERRCLYLVSRLEALPNKSLVLIEEPEASLHPTAQVELARYFIDVCLRKGHQIIATTHSDHLLAPLDAESRIFLHRSQSHLSIIEGIPTSQARALLTDGVHKALNVLVEDSVAESVLQEVLRKFDILFLKSVGIYSTETGAQDLKRIAKSVPDSLKTAIVLDGDMSSDVDNRVLKLPGTLPPEKELFNCPAFIELVKQKYDFSIADFLASQGQGFNPHQYFERLAEKVNQKENVLISEAAVAYVHSLPEPECQELVEKLKQFAQ